MILDVTVLTLSPTTGSVPITIRNGESRVIINPRS